MIRLLIINLLFHFIRPKVNCLIWRQVQHDLQRDINSLGTRLKLINIALVPVIVMIVALVYGSRRRRKQTQTQLKQVDTA